MDNSYAAECRNLNVLKNCKPTNSFFSSSRNRKAVLCRVKVSLNLRFRYLPSFSVYHIQLQSSQILVFYGTAKLAKIGCLLKCLIVDRSRYKKQKIQGISKLLVRFLVSIFSQSISFYKKECPNSIINNVSAGVSTLDTSHFNTSVRCIFTSYFLCKYLTKFSTVNQLLCQCKLY